MGEEDGSSVPPPPKLWFPGGIHIGDHGPPLSCKLSMVNHPSPCIPVFAPVRDLRVVQEGVTWVSGRGGGGIL